MPIPQFDEKGDLPVGVHQATLEEVTERFGNITPQRQLVTQRLKRIYKLARATGKLFRFVVFGSYVTAKPAPNDVDIILVMQDDFIREDYTKEFQPLFDHIRAQKELGASIFAIRPSLIFLETVDEFIAHWQTTREKSRRGIVEIITEKSDD